MNDAAAAAVDATEHRRLVSAVALKRFAMLPEVTLRIIEVIERGNYTAAELEKVVSTDPALCLQILKVVNSAFYGADKEIASIQRAVVRLGGPAVKNIALATSLGRVLRGGSDCAGVSAQHLWRHSLAVAAAAKHVAGLAHCEHGEEAFLGGLLHDVGFMVEMRAEGDKAADLGRRLQGGTEAALEAETAVFGVTHHDFGRSLCELWRLPVAITEVVGTHHVPGACPEEAAALACIVHVADYVAQTAELGFALDAAGRSLDQGAVERLALTAADLEQAAAALPEMADELLQILR